MADRPMKVIYLVGIPGSGKSTTLAGALRLITGEPEQQEQPVPHMLFPNGMIELGRRRVAFSGTDALALNINPRACDWIAQTPAPVILGEGDRLANERFFRTATEHGTLVLVHLDTPLPEARSRRAARADALGQPDQEEAWWKGRCTKVRRLCTIWPHVTLNGSRPPDRLATDLAAILTA